MMLARSGSSGSTGWFSCRAARSFWSPARGNEELRPLPALGNIPTVPGVGEKPQEIIRLRHPVQLPLGSIPGAITEALENNDSEDVQNLLARARQADRQAFDELFRGDADRLRRLAAGHQ